MNGSSVGIDVGGTFTDLVSVDSPGATRARKVLSTGGGESVGVMTALDSLGDSAAELIVHGTSVATNTLLERNGAREALCITDSVADLLALRRQQRASLLDLALHHPDPLVPRRRSECSPCRHEQHAQHSEAIPASCCLLLLTPLTP